MSCGDGGKLSRVVEWTIAAPHDVQVRPQQQEIIAVDGARRGFRRRSTAARAPWRRIRHLGAGISVLAMVAHPGAAATALTCDRSRQPARGGKSLDPGA